MSRINVIIDLLEQNQPVYYTSTNNLSYENGVKMSQTWADYIRLDTEHGPFNIAGIKEFMEGLIAGGPTKSGHRSPAVIAELPFDGHNKDVVINNSWMIKQLLACGIHGIILCHVESSEAVKSFVEAVRYPFHKQEVGNGL